MRFRMIYNLATFTLAIQVKIELKDFAHSSSAYLIAFHAAHTQFGEPADSTAWAHDPKLQNEPSLAFLR